MKWILILVVIAAVAAFLLLKQPWTPAPAESHPATAPAAPSTPSIAPAPATPAAAPVVVKRIAPKGVYFLVQAVSITSDSGITTLTAGTKVTFVKEKGKNWVVTDGENEVEVAQDLVTNDLDIADAAAKRGRDHDAAASAAVRSQQEMVQKARQDSLAKEREREAAIHAAATTPAPAPAATSLPDVNHTNTSTGGTPPPFGRPAPP